MRQSDKNKFIAILITLLITSFFGTGCETPTDSEEPYTLHFTPGTYEASATGYNQKTPIEVKVTFSETAITNISIVAHSETPGRCEDTLDLIPKAIIQEQALALDAVSGATAAWTRKGILDAVEDCVKQAGGDEAVAKLKD
jgi:fumarate reductase flavoprotein subunit